MASYLAEDGSVIESRRAETPRDLHTACGIGVGVLFGVVAWIAIITVGVAAMRWF